MKDKILKILPLIILVLAIGFSPSFPAGKLVNGKTIELRVEDFLIAILAGFLLIKFLTSRKIEKPPLLIPILIWLGVSVLSFFLNFLLFDLNFVKGMFYVLKEIQYFAFYFYFFWSIRDVYSAKNVIYAWFVVVVVNISYILSQVLFNFRAGNIYQFFAGDIKSKSDYGASAIAEEGSLPKGMFFLLLFIFLVNVFLYHFLNLNISKAKKFFLGLISFSPAIGIFYSGSRTAFLGFVLSLTLILGFLLFKKRNLKIILVLIVGLALLIIIFSLLLKDFTGPKRIVRFLFSADALISTFFKSRINSAILPILRRALAKDSPLLFVIGLGKGYFGEAHNQYVLNFISVGIAGSVAFFILIFSLIRKSWKGFFRSKSSLAESLSVGLLIATVTMLFCSLASDPFLVVKSAEIYWSFAGIVMAVLALDLEKNQKKLDNVNI